MNLERALEHRRWPIAYCLSAFLATAFVLNDELCCTKEDTMGFILLVAMLAGFLMYMLCSQPKAQDIGKMLLFSSMLALLIALAPSTMHLLSRF